MVGDLPLFDPFKALAEIRSQGALKDGRKLPQKLPQTPAEVDPISDQEVRATSATSATSAGVSRGHDLAHARVQTTACKNLLYISRSYTRIDRPNEDAAAHARETPAEVAEVAEFSLSHSNKTVFVQDEVAEVLRKQLRKFRTSLASLSPDRSPCPGYHLREWPAVLSRAQDFLDTFGLQALRLGWTAPRLFGVHPEAGIVRVDACGALVLPLGGTVRAITATSVRFDHLTHREKPGQPEGVPLWEFGRHA